MKKLITLSLFTLLFAVLCPAQGTQEALQQDPRRAGGSFYVYDYEHPAAMTPAPEDYKPFYISYFARHGARCCTSEYNTQYGWLSKAAEKGLFTQEGEALWERFPEVFDGPTHVEAFSTESPRVIMSMWFI